MKYITRVKDQEYEIEIDRDDEIIVNGERFRIDFSNRSPNEPVSLLINNRSIAALVDEQEGQWKVLMLGELYTADVQDERSYRLAQARATLVGEEDTAVTSPMPGLILKVLVTEGQAVAKGDKVVILESMKMENELRSARDGVVMRVHVAAGDSVEKNQPLVTIGDLDDETDWQ